MEDQINQFIEYFGRVTTEDVASPDARHLLMINDNAERLLKEKSETFHLVTVKLLYMIKIVRPD